MAFVRRRLEGAVIVGFGAGRGNRTPTLLPELDFESSASTNSAIPAAGSSVTRGAWPGLALPTHGEAGIIGQKRDCFKRGVASRWPIESTTSPISTSSFRRN
jgi:hypothetical protein